MPRGDGTGPLGRGPLTGWGRGYCAAASGPGSRMWGPGFGRGRGFGFRGFAAGAPGFFAESRMPEDVLRNRADALRAELKAIEDRLDESDE